MSNLQLVTSTMLSSSAGVRFGMSTRMGGVSRSPLGMNTSYNVGDNRADVTENRRRLLERLGTEESRVAQPKQCHSSEVAIAEKPGWYDGVDGLITKQRDLWLGVSVADCVPIFLADAAAGCVAAVHAGWRGSEAEIVRHTLEVMESRFGCRASRVLAFIGPRAGVCCYEVQSDVATRFDSNVLISRHGKYFLDLGLANEHQLIQHGVPPTSIELNPDCTICNPEKYHSYRRDRAHSGRMAGFIALQ